MRAAAEDLPAARLMGIKVNRVVATAFAIGAGAGGRRRPPVLGPGRPDQPVHGLHAGAQGVHRGGHRRLREHRRGGRSAATCSGFLEVLVTALAGIGDLLPPGSVPPEVRAFLQSGCPSGLASWRDAVVFVVLILVLLVRPQGILGRRGRGRRAVSDGDRAAARGRPGPRDRRSSRSALAGLDASGQAFWQGLAINLAIFMILTVSLNLTSGFTGVFSLGQIGFMALGAYISAILTLPLAEKAAYLPDLPAWLAGVHLDQEHRAVPGRVPRSRR